MCCIGRAELCLLLLGSCQSASSQQTGLLANQTGDSTGSAENLEGIQSPRWQGLKYMVVRKGDPGVR